MDKLKSLISRIRWPSVIAVLLLFVALYLAYTYIPSGYQVGGGIGLYAGLEPSAIVPGEDAVVEVELKNMNSDKGLEVYIKGLTYHESLFFEDTYAQTYTSSKITIGPQEIRKLSLKLRSREGIMDGKYAIDLKAYENGKEDKGAKQRVFIEIQQDKE